MDENQAWNEFEKSGSVDSYLKYIKLKSKNFKEEFGKIKGDSGEIIQGKRDSN